MMSAIKQRNDIDLKYSKTLADLIAVRKELSELKRKKKIMHG
jgi:hypothetical protein